MRKLACKKIGNAKGNALLSMRPPRERRARSSHDWGALYLDNQ